MQAEKNKREFSRVEIQMLAELTVAGQPSIRGQLHDVSMNGLCVECESDFHVGDTCHVRILLGEPEAEIAIQAEGEVNRRMGANLAISFTSVDSESYQHLQNLVLYNAEDTQKIEHEFATHLGIKRKQD